MKAVKIIVIGIIVLLGLFLTAYYLLSDKKGMTIPQTKQTISYKSITSQKLRAVLSQKDFFFVNVHIPYEGEIEKTDAFIAYNEIAKNLDKLPKDKSEKIVVYCRSGMMSQIAAQTLVSLGYTNVYNLTNGMIDWENQGYLLIQNPR